MTNQHSEKLRGIRGIRGISDDLWATLDAAAKATGSDRSTVSRAYYEWFAGRPGAQLPERPEPQQPAS